MRVTLQPPLVSGAPAGEQDVLVTFTASIVGSETANLAISDNDGNTHVVSLTGTGIATTPFYYTNIAAETANGLAIDNSSHVWELGREYCWRTG